MNNSQVTVPRFSETSLSMPFSMLCPGISQNTKLHHLTLYKGQVWGEKSYFELCNHNLLNIVYSWSANGDSDRWPIVQNGELYVPPIPGEGFINDYTRIPWDSEILQSFTELTNITNITFHSFDSSADSIWDVTYQIAVGRYRCEPYHYKQCVPPFGHFPNYIWTKDGFKIQTKKIIQT